LEKRNRRLAEAAQSTTQKNEENTAKPRPEKQRSKLTWKEQKELEVIEQTIMSAEADVERIEAIFILPAYHEKYGAKTSELTKELTVAKGKVEQLYARWHELEELKKVFAI
ncbi:MAG: ABC transporter ATP-binding protein, partial [Ignavibacteriae bacterium]|nr:ABC transporter ATP-binding protein [Ignavibacteriota bacterium]